MKIRGVEFEVEYEWDYPDRKRIDSMAVFLPGSDVELSGVLDEEVLHEIEEKIYRDGPVLPDYDYGEDR